ncbi:MAG: uncharacterized protein QOE92_2485 [Chloroflexota bacterium]|nr:uncharacterized protein [Chloroflexota bacterium]
MTSTCVAAGGHTALYVGGTPIGPCGAVVVADQLVADGDPNDCPGLHPEVAGATHYRSDVRMSDGVSIHVDTYRPTGMSLATRTPVILVMTPYGNSGGTGPYPGGADVTPANDGTSNAVLDELAVIAPGLLSRGYSIAVATFRGFGYSGGCDDFGGRRAQLDVAEVIQWLADREWSSGRVGMYGMSASGWAGMMGLAGRPPALAAVVLEAPPIDRYAQAYMNGVPYAILPEANAVRYTELDLLPPSLLSSAQQLKRYAASGTQSAAGCDAANIAGSASPDPDSPFWVERNLIPRVSGSTVPVLLAQGMMDSNVKPAAFMPVWSSLRGPHRLWAGQFEHVRTESDLVGRTVPDADPALAVRPFRDEALRWFDTYVRGIAASATGVDGDPAVELERSDGSWRSEDQWPPARAIASVLSLRPGTYQDVKGNSAEAAAPKRTCPNASVDGSAECLRTRNGVGAWTFSEPLPAAQEVAGVPRLSVTTTTKVAKATLVALVYDVDQRGRATLLDRGASRIPSAGVTTTTIDLYPQDWYLAAGHRVGILLTGADDEWFNPVSTGTEVRVLGGSISLPVLPEPGVSNLSGGPSAAIGDRRPIQVQP